MENVETSTALVSLVLAAGVSAQELALAAKLEPRVIESPTLVPYATGIRLWEAAETLTGDAAVGLHAGEACTADRVPVLGTLFGHSDHLGDALERLARLLPTVIRNAPVAFERDADGGTFSYRSPSVARHGVDAMFAGILAIGRRSADHRVVPQAVGFQSARPPAPAEYARFFGVEPSWGASVSSMRFGASDLARPFRGAAPALAHVLETNANALIGTDDPSASDIARAAAAAVHRCVDRGAPPTIGEVSSQLGMSPRTLQRALSEATRTFREVRDEALHERARAMISESGEPIASIATRLGFASRTSFERAYRRWEGESPAQTRARRRGAG